MTGSGAIRVLEHFNLTPPPSVAAACVRAGGLNRFGDPNYRLVWGWQALELRGGEVTDYDDDGYPIRTELRYEWWPRYAPKNSRFHLQVWVPPEKYGSPDDWYEITESYIRGQKVARLGDYPHRGDYELVATMEGPNGEYVAPNAQAVEDMIRLHQRVRHRKPYAIRESLNEELESRKREREQKYRDILDSQAVAFPWKTWVPVTGPSPRQIYS